MTPAETKRALRHRMLAELGDRPPTAAEAKPLAEGVEALPEWRQGRVVAVFAALRGEPDLDRLWEVRGERVFCLAAMGSAGPEFRIAPTRSSLVYSARAFFEPAPGPALDPTTIDLFLVPGLAFDRFGFRLGRGAGYYDRLLAGRRPDAIALGITLDRFLVAELPHESHDVPMSAVLTESGLRAVDRS